MQYLLLFETQTQGYKEMTFEILNAWDGFTHTFICEPFDEGRKTSFWRLFVVLRPTNLSMELYYMMH